MKVIPLYLLIILLVSCKKNDGPTIFEGKVVFEDDRSVYNQSYIVIEGLSKSFPSTPIFGERDSLFESGEFEIEIEAMDDIRVFSIGVSTAARSFGQSTGLECSLQDCDEFQPGKKYTDLVIRVPGVEE